ncbi:MAG: bifunctional oligoribonuclease/PAP phosphatase NrnA [Oscillospiraceae bacterium]|nr:bifunctional oligoribonuclease/PAP phosphatase NrnA [Oscillospiraceae bacterium]
MSKSISLGELAEKILDIRFDNILIVCHINPDPDTLGSALGLKYILKEFGRKSYIVCDSKVNERICGYFDISREIDLDIIEKSGFTPDYTVCVDTASIGQTGRYGDIYKIDLVIDHHYTNTFYGGQTYLDEKAAAAGEIIFKLAKKLNLEITREFAKYIYCAIICDTGSFKYPSVTPGTLTAAAELISTGFDFAKLNRLIFQNKTLEQIRLEKLAYESLEFFADGKIAVVVLTNKSRGNAGLSGIELDETTDMPRIIEGVEVGVRIHEIESDINKIKKYKVSLRSNDYVNVAEIALAFGGGGHMRAAGFRYGGEIDSLINSLVGKTERCLL